LTKYLLVPAIRGFIAGTQCGWFNEALIGALSGAGIGAAMGAANGLVVGYVVMYQTCCFIKTKSQLHHYQYS
jgi:hypothetical protein